ncbi:trehalose-phosphatase [Rhizobium oryzicola]|uniref:Trehalose 6-phosphate phosphatase n=1 Tax=Rhizobium oryzicola TaxID=1232668 RepID=A0ABT8SQT1_9HYPH|nr:trehalose-phosphatase [Rhizobium oryzicola]MDO1580746.1 trehalose-phosphatase [Rhizobium oryzicola]
MEQTDTSRGEVLAASDEQPLAPLLAEPDQWALFLDIDGTLVDLAETPDSVVVEPGLTDTLQALSHRLGGALALVTGRALPYADQLLQPLALPIAGLHGAERRRADGSVDAVTPEPSFVTLKRSLERVTSDWDGVIIEDKGGAVAAHFRQAPERQASLEAVMAAALSEAGPDYSLQRGKMVLEIRPARANKGSAVEAFLSEAPFSGRKPIAIGDDLTDEAMFRFANEAGGLSIHIGEAADTAAQFTLPSPDALRQALRRIATE